MGPGRADVMDIGETAYAMVLADDLDGDGFMELLLATMGGNLYCLATGARTDPLATWTSQVRPWRRTGQRLPCFALALMSILPLTCLHVALISLGAGMALHVSLVLRYAAGCGFDMAPA